MQVRSRRRVPPLRSLVRSAVCPLLLLIRTTADCVCQLAVCTAWLVVSTARALLALALEAVRVAGWLAYYAVHTPLSAVVQCVAAIFWLVRLAVCVVRLSFTYVILFLVTGGRYIGVFLMTNVMRLCRALLALRSAWSAVVHYEGRWLGNKRFTGLVMDYLRAKCSQHVPPAVCELVDDKMKDL